MRRPRATTPEGAVLRACLLLLEARRWPAWRANTGCAYLPGRGGLPRPVRFGPPGQADILGLVPGSGRLLAVECKAHAGARPTAAQAAFLGRVRDAGGVALVISDPGVLARCLDDLTRDPTATFDLRGERA